MTVGGGLDITLNKSGSIALRPVEVDYLYTRFNSSSINTPGDSTGQYIDAKGVNHGFLRISSGHIVTFNVPGAGTATGQGTIPSSNNDMDAITGDYVDSAGVFHGFLLTQ